MENKEISHEKQGPKGLRRYLKRVAPQAPQTYHFQNCKCFVSIIFIFATISKIAIILFLKIFFEFYGRTWNIFFGVSKTANKYLYFSFQFLKNSLLSVLQPHQLKIYATLFSVPPQVCI
jgi:hypothetical protein